MKLGTAVVVAALLAASASAVAQARRDGNWEVTVEMQIPGLPQSMPPRIITQCITKDDAADPQKMLPQGQRGNMPNNCKVSDMKNEGNKVSWAMKCEGPQAMSGTGEIIYKDNAY